MHERVLKYQKTIPGKLANKSNPSRHKVEIWFFLSARIYSSPAAWAKDLSSDACFRSIASFGDPHYLSRTAPHSIQCAQNSRSWNFEFRKTLLPLRNLWNLKRVTPVAGLMDLFCFYYFVRNSLVALLEALCARIFSFIFVNIGFVPDIFFCVCVCVQGL